MKYTTENWPFKWFGFWNEYGNDYINYPSIFNFINPKTNQSYPIDDLVSYLENGLALASTSKASFPYPLTGEQQTGSISIRTDGKWLWLDNICDLIKKDNLILPKEFYTHIVNNNFLIPAISDESLDELEWPQILE